MAIGNVLRQLMDDFQNASEETIIGTAVNSIGDFINQSGMKTPQRIFQAMVIAAKVGIATKTGSLNDKEKQISDEVFGRIWKGDMETIYAMLSQEIEEGEYQFLQVVGATPIGIELLKFILAFAYIDGEVDEAIAERLEGCFGVALLAKKKAAEEKARKEREEAERKRKEEEDRKINEKIQKNINRDRARCKIAMGMIACSMYHLVAVKPDGTVIAAGKNDHKQCDVSGWRDIVAVDCDESGTVGLTKDGRVKYTGWNVHKESGCMSWSGIKQVVMSSDCVFGLKNDGTVVATPSHAHANSQAPDVTTWRNIVELRRMGECVVGIDTNGKAISVVRNYYGRTENERCYAKEGIIDAAVGDYDSVITMKKDGTCGAFSPSQYKPQEIVKLYMLSKRPIALLSDGKVIMEEWKAKRAVDRFATDHASEKMVAVSGSLYTSAFLSENGRIYVVCDSGYRSSGELSAGEPFGKGFQLFDSFTKMMDEKDAAIAKAEAEKAAAEQRGKEEEAKKAERRTQGVCQYCGGTLKKGLFSTKCTSCGKKKDY